MTWFPLFLDLFAMGVVAALVAVHFRDIGSYYYRFHAALALVLSTLGTLIGTPWAELARGNPMQRTVAAVGLLFGVLVLVFNFIARAARRELRTDAILLPVSTGIVFASLWSFQRIEYGTLDAVLLTLHLLTSSAVLGSALVAMSTGHWYLANAALSFDLLVRLCRCLVAALVLKALVSAAFAARSIDAIRALESFDLLVIGVRVAAGLVLALVLAFMSLSCAKRKSNQSATGILYVAVVFVLMGECISLYLTLKPAKGLWIPV